MADETVMTAEAAAGPVAAALGLPRPAVARPVGDPERGVQTAEEALAGACDVVAETINEHAAVRDALRALFARSGIITAVAPDAAEKDPARTYATYYSFTARVSAVAPHQTLALNRGEKAGVLRMAVEAPEGEALAVVAQHFAPRPRSPLADDLRNAAADAYRRLIAPSLERETRTTLTEAAEEHAIRVLARNLRALLLQPPPT